MAASWRDVRAMSVTDVDPISASPHECSQREGSFCLLMCRKSDVNGYALDILAQTYIEFSREGTIYLY